MSLRNFVNKIKIKYDIPSDWDVALIFTVYSMAGMGAAFSRRLLFALTGLGHAPLWLQIVVSICVFIPLYQLSTLFFGTLLGQFSFFWKRQKQLAKAFRRVIFRMPEQASLKETT